MSRNTLTGIAMDIHWRFAMDQIARTPKQLGEALKRERRKQGITQMDLGKKTTLRQATISAVENGEPGTHLRTICDMMAVLGLEFVIRRRDEGKTKSIEDIF